MDAAQNKVNNNIREGEEAKEKKKRGQLKEKEKKWNKSVGEGMMDHGLDTDYNT